MRGARAWASVLVAALCMHAAHAAVGVTISKATLVTLEGATKPTYTVVLDSAPDGVVVLDITNPSTADVTIDIGGSVGTKLTFTTGNWNVAQTVGVTATDESIVEGTETITLTHVMNAAQTLDTSGYDTASFSAGNTVTVTVHDANALGVVLSKSTLSAVEGGSSQTYTVVLNSKPTGDVVLDIANPSAADLTISTAKVTFTAANWNSAQTITVTATDESIVEGVETHQVTHAMNAGETADTSGYDTAPF
jgi:hypothetical protein